MTNTEILHVAIDFILVDQLLLEDRVQEYCYYSGHPLLVNFLVLGEVTALTHDVS